MNKTLFVGNIESPFIIKVMEMLVLSDKELIIGIDSYKMLYNYLYTNRKIKNRIKTWSWNNTIADYNVQDLIIDLFPYLYPDTINNNVTKKLLGTSGCTKRSFGNFRLGFGVQEELFDLFLAQYFDVNELAYFDILSSLRLLNPVGQIEYRKKSCGFLRFIGSDVYMLSEQKLLCKKYKIISPIPFFESFSEKFEFRNTISHYSIEK